MFDFNEVIERRGTNSLKYDFAAENGKPEDVLPLWVADMDFASPPAVREALMQRVNHGIFGYSYALRESYFNVLHNWYKTYFGWNLNPEWLVQTPGVVFAICAAIRAFTEPWDAVLIQQPVYYPFESSVKANNRRLIVNQLVYENGKYHMNLEEMERQIIDEQVKLFILCSPHNPVGRVWTREELEAVGDICVKHGVYIISDEIHADFTYDGIKHHVFADLKPEYAERTITCTSPSKTFNIAGLQISNIFISNEKIRKDFVREIACSGYNEPNLMGMIACQAAYENGRQWFEELKIYLADNLSFVRNFLNEKLPGIQLVEPEGTYLAWLDFKLLNLSDKDLEELILRKARLWLDAGVMFGAGGEGFQRLNIACPRSILKIALERLWEVFKNIGTY